MNCHDGLGEFSLLDTSFPELLLRASWSWQQCVNSMVSHRSSFQGLASSDPVTTRAFVATLSVSEQGLMRKALNGALFTNDSVCHFSHSGTTVCQFCGEEDSRFHRFWQCKVFSDVRKVDLPGFWDSFPQLPMSLLCHGWAIRPATWFEWNKCLLNIPSPDIHVTSARQVHGLLQSAYRAELQAVCCAVQYALHWKRRVRIWSDCKSVVQKFVELVHYNR